MLGLSFVDLLIIGLGALTFIIWHVFYFNGQKYNSLFDVLLNGFTNQLYACNGKNFDSGADGYADISLGAGAPLLTVDLNSSKSMKIVDLLGNHGALAQQTVGVGLDRCLLVTNAFFEDVTENNDHRKSQEEKDKHLDPLRHAK